MDQKLLDRINRLEKLNKLIQDKLRKLEKKFKDLTSDYGDESSSDSDTDTDSDLF